MDIVKNMYMMVYFREWPYDKYRQAHIPVSSEGFLASFVNRNRGLVAGNGCRIGSVRRMLTAGTFC